MVIGDRRYRTTHLTIAFSSTEVEARDCTASIVSTAPTVFLLVIFFIAFIVFVVVFLPGPKLVLIKPEPVGRPPAIISIPRPLFIIIYL